MAKVGLNDICAKLSRNAEMTSREVDSYSMSYCDNNTSSFTIAVDGVDEQHRVVAAAGSASLPPPETINAATHENAATLVSSDDVGTLKSGDGTTSLMDSDYREDSDSLDNCGIAGVAGRRNRRKNFLPRCVQDGLVVVERVPGTSAAPTTAWSTDVEDDQTALDLRTCRSLSTPTRQNSDFSAICLKKSIVDKQNQVLDLSTSRCDRSALDSGVERDTRESRTTTRWTMDRRTGGELNSVDMRVYAVNTMTELLNIYGLPDEHQSAATDLRDLRKWVPPVGTSSDTPRGVDLRPVQLGVTASDGRLQNRDRLQVVSTSLSSRRVPDSVVGRTPELIDVKGQLCRDAVYDIRVSCSICFVHVCSLVFVDLLRENLLVQHVANPTRQRGGYTPYTLHLVIKKVWDELLQICCEG